MEINRKQILESFIELISHIANEEYQKRVWIEGRGPEVDDFDETVCNFFQDGNGILNNIEDFGLTEMQYRLLKKMRDEFRKFCDGPVFDYNIPYDLPIIPEWKKIIELAKKILKAFSCKIKLDNQTF